MKTGRFIAALLLLILAGCHMDPYFMLDDLQSPILLKGDSVTAYRDPAVLYEKDKFYLFFTLVEIEPDSMIYSYTAMRSSRDLKRWSPIKKLTPRDQTILVDGEKVAHGKTLDPLEIALDHVLNPARALAPELVNSFPRCLRRG